MSQRQFATHAFALFCFILAIYLSLGGWLQFRFGRWGIVINQIGILLLPALLYLKLRGLAWKKFLPCFEPEGKEVLLVLLLTALVIAPVELMIHFQQQVFPLPESIEAFYESLTARTSWQDGIMQFIALAVVPAVCEEVFFRGFMQSMFQSRFGKWQAVALTALFFAVAHMNPWYLVYYFILGLYFGWLREWRGNLVLCMIAHLFNNLYSLYA